MAASSSAFGSTAALRVVARLVPFGLVSCLAPIVGVSLRGLIDDDLHTPHYAVDGERGPH